MRVYSDKYRLMIELAQHNTLAVGKATSVAFTMSAIFCLVLLNTMQVLGLLQTTDCCLIFPSYVPQGYADIHGYIAIRQFYSIVFRYVLLHRE